MTAYHATFMSHAHADNVTVADYAARLRAKGVDLWLDLNDAQKGHDLSTDITAQLERRSAFVLMVTAASNTSRWVGMEVSNFIALYNDKQMYQVNGVERLILPVRLEDVPIPSRLRAFNWIDAVGRPRDQVVDEIARALQVQAHVIPDPPARQPQLPPAPQPAWDEIAIPARLDGLGFQGWRDRKTGVSFIIPPVCQVPAGKFTMGSAQDDPQAFDDEKPQYSVFVGDFEIGAYPVTVAEYALAVQAGAVPAPQGDDDERYGWKQQQQHPDHPVVRVSWQDAQKYVQWLAGVTGQLWRLPTEAEWEKAARGTDGRIYPWGNQWDKARANTRDGGPIETTPVGAYAAKGDASPYGCHDMAGNVWEWTHTAWYDQPPYDINKYENDSDNRRVLRGGSWDYIPQYARAACRDRSDWVDWDNRGGFRLARGRVGW